MQKVTFKFSDVDQLEVSFNNEDMYKLEKVLDMPSIQIIRSLDEQSLRTLIAILYRAEKKRNPAIKESAIFKKLDLCQAKDKIKLFSSCADLLCLALYGRSAKDMVQYADEIDTDEDENEEQQEKSGEERNF